MQISKTTAGQVAELLVKQKREAVAQLKDDLSKAVLAAWKEKTPDELLAMFVKYPQHFRRTSSVTVHGNGFNWYNISVSEQATSDNSGHAMLEPDSKLAAKLSAIKNRFEKADAACKKLKVEIESALISLKTTKRIIEQFPEAEKYLPVGDTMAVVVNLDKIRAELKTA